MANTHSPYATRIKAMLVFCGVVIFCMMAAFIILLDPGILQANACTRLAALVLCLLAASVPLQFLPRRGQSSDASQLAAIGIKGASLFGLILVSIAAFVLALLHYTPWAWCMITLCIGGTFLMLSLSNIALITIDKVNETDRLK
ncbi:hypothetical protein ACU81Q_12780 [Komagataeibacter melomenusus]